MEIVEIEQLEEGDHILLSCQAFFKYLIVLKKPQLGTKTHWKTGKPLYRSVKCSGRRESELVSYTRHGHSYQYTINDWKFTPEDHNIVQYLDLHDRQILRINK